MQVRPDVPPDGSTKRTMKTKRREACKLKETEVKDQKSTQHICALRNYRLRKDVPQESKDVGTIRNIMSPSNKKRSGGRGGVAKQSVRKHTDVSESKKEQNPRVQQKHKQAQAKGNRGHKHEHDARRVVTSDFKSGGGQSARGLINQQVVRKHTPTQWQGSHTQKNDS